MFAIEAGHKKINDRIVETFERSVMDHQTPCRKAGGRTYLSLMCLEGDFHFEPVTDDDGEVFGIEIACCGDAALDAFMKALEFACEAINDQRCDVDD